MKTIFVKVPTYSSGVIIHFLNQLKLSAKKSSSEDEGKSSVLEINYPEEKQPIIDELKNILNALIQANLIILMSIKDLLININSKESILNQLFNKPTVNPDLEELCERIGMILSCLRPILKYRFGSCKLILVMKRGVSEVFFDSVNKRSE